jgi:hypothetical protein
MDGCYRGSSLQLEIQLRTSLMLANFRHAKQKIKMGHQ